MEAQFVVFGFILSQKYNNRKVIKIDLCNLEFQDFERNVMKLDLHNELLNHFKILNGQLQWS